MAFSDDIQVDISAFYTYVEMRFSLIEILRYIIINTLLKLPIKSSNIITITFDGESSF